jgi:hypothetical protein
VFVDPSDRQLGLLVVLQIWRDLFLVVSLAFAGGRGEVISLEQGCWSRGGIRCSSPTLSMRGGRSWSKTARGHPPIDVTHRHVSCCVQRTCSSTHKFSLAMLLSWIWQWWRLHVPSGVRLGGAGVGRRPLASAVAGNPRIDLYLSIFLNFYLQSF